MADTLRAKPRIRFASDYAFEKNGLRFPGSYDVVESYRLPRGTAWASRTSVVHDGYKFFEVKVKSEVKRGDK
jgi:hypothetical protein